MVGIQDELKKFYTVIREGLQEKLGAVLFQFPGSFEFASERLACIIENLDPTFENVVEFRNATWWQANVGRLLGLSGIRFCSVSYPGLSDKPVLNSPITYYRFHDIPNYIILFIRLTFYKPLPKLFCITARLRKFIFSSTILQQEPLWKTGRTCKIIFHYNYLARSYCTGHFISAPSSLAA